ncbi:hypothetical protein [Streptomyces sp. SID13726]|uniref:hypothetical protein n=1 Tax=Streptomyces sp. SID13726 TaxID=2706058 RepID=UPI0013BC41BA|nr:hypothetical protein [Streptomyces sp. SID13726]NEB00593.1 hypothetical protein [Streptomyces sp. SID13726]
MTSRETEMIAALAEAKSQGLARLGQLEAGLFRFAMGVRAFLDAFPEDLPAPSRISPHFSDTAPSCFLHLVCQNRTAVELWAARLDAPVKTEPHNPGNVHLNTTGLLDGLRVSVSCIDVADPADGGVA